MKNSVEKCNGDNAHGMIADLKALAGTMRLQFLVLTPAVMLLGLATAYWKERDQVSLPLFFLALAGGICAHISVNALNEYSDFNTGLDSHTKRTPFSGGSGSLQARPDLADNALRLGVAAALFTVATGLFFAMQRGWGLLPLIIAGILVVSAYTPLLTHNPLACLAAPGLGFGILVMGTHFVLTGHYDMTGFTASMVVFFLVNDLLLLNQFPDVEADRITGRLHFPIAIGRKKSAWIYTIQLGLAYLVIIAGVTAGWLPSMGLLGLVTIPVAVSTAKGAVKYADDMDRLLPYLGKNVFINLATPVLLATGLILDAVI